MSHDDSVIPQTLHAEMYCPSCDASYAPQLQICPKDGTALIGIAGQPRDAMRGRVLNGRYRLEGEIGSGGMGVVYRATQLDLDREVAIKLILSEYAKKSDTVKRFLRESRISGKLSHPNIVAVQEMGRTDDGELFLAMELLRGRSLEALSRETGPMPVERAAWIVSQVCEALIPAHQSDVVHRDLKPQNIMVLDEPPGRDFVKVLDFGLAKSLNVDSSVTQTGSLVGTPLYMPPEMLLGSKIDARCDLYSLGVIFYKLVSGTLPFVGETMTSLMWQQAHAEPAPLAVPVPEAVKAVIFKLMEKDPSKRYASASETRTAIANALGLGEDLFDSFPMARSQENARLRLETVDAQGEDTSTERLPRSKSALPAFAPWLALVLVLAAALVFVVMKKSSAKVSSDNVLVANAQVDVTTSDASASATGSLATLAVDAGSVATKLDASLAPEAAPAEVELRFESSPSAIIMVQGKSVGHTPLTIRVPASDAAIDVLLRRKGYRSETIRVQPSESQVIEKALQRAAVKQPRGGKNSDLPF